MSDKKSAVVRDVGPDAISISCTECGGEITHSDEYGMWCDKQCGREESIAAKPQVEALIAGFVKMFGGPR